MEKNVEKFVYTCGKNIGKWKEGCFVSEVEMFADEGYGVWDKEIESPIEQILFAAILHNIKINGVPLADPETIGEYDVVFGVDIEPQLKIGKYRVDFKIRNVRYIYDNKKQCLIVDESKFVLIECDSQEWHERTEKERRYEKARDRYFAKHNLKIFHYTSKEIISKPYEIAAEILYEILGYNCNA